MASYTNLEKFKDTPRRRGRGLEALAGKLQQQPFPIFRKYILPTAKKLGKDALEAGLPELGEVIADRSSIKKAAKWAAKTTVRKQLGVGKRNESNRKKRETIQIIKSRRNQRRSWDDFFRNIS